jgi:hypothetical protein
MEQRVTVFLVPSDYLTPRSFDWVVAYVQSDLLANHGRSTQPLMAAYLALAKQSDGVKIPRHF